MPKVIFRVPGGRFKHREWTAKSSDTKSCPIKFKWSIRPLSFFWFPCSTKESIPVWRIATFWYEPFSLRLKYTPMVYTGFFLLLQVSPLQRMVAGGFIAGIAFVCSGVLEYALEHTYPMLPSKGEAFVNFVNSLPCDLTVVDSHGNYRVLISGDMTTIKRIPVQNRSEYNVVIAGPAFCNEYQVDVPQFDMNIPVTEREVSWFAFNCTIRQFVRRLRRAVLIITADTAQTFKLKGM